MLELKVKDKTYKVKFGYNSFCDTDLMDRTSELLKIFQGEGVADDNDVAGLGQVKQLFICVRDLLFVGFKKYNPVESLQEVGDILDDYHDEATDEDSREILTLFISIANELMNEGFLGEMLKTEETPKTPQDHKKSQKK